MNDNTSYTEDSTIKDIVESPSVRVNMRIPGWIYDIYIKNFKGNRTQYIMNYFVKGFEYDTTDYKVLKLRNVELVQMLENQKKEIDQMKLQMASLKKKYSSRIDPETQIKLNFAKGMKNAGVLRDVI